MIYIIEDPERELDVRCKIIYDMTKEIVENRTKANSRLFYWAYHETWMLKLFPKCLASKKAYELFFEKYKKDIRECDWFNQAILECRDDKDKRLFMHEHLTTSEDFKQELIYLYKNNQLSVEKIKELISQQRVCWITRDEDDKLNKSGYNKHRPDPLAAYTECGIEIYDAENADLSNIMKPSVHPQKYKTTAEKYFEETLKDSKIAVESIEIMIKIANKISSTFPNFNVHTASSYVQIWKKTWNNRGKKGIHFELAPQQVHDFDRIAGKENFVITFKLHNEANTQHIMPQIPRTKVYFKKEYSFLKNDLDSSIEQLIKDIARIISIDENTIDNAHQNY